MRFCYEIVFMIFIAAANGETNDLAHNKQTTFLAREREEKKPKTFLLN